jgi:hypothetical protein
MLHDLDKLIRDKQRALSRLEKHVQRIREILSQAQSLVELLRQNRELRPSINLQLLELDEQYEEQTRKHRACLWLLRQTRECLGEERRGRLPAKLRIPEE